MDVTNMGQWEEVPRDEPWTPAPENTDNAYDPYATGPAEAPVPVYNTAPGSGYRRLPTPEPSETAGAYDFAAPTNDTASAPGDDPSLGYGTGHAADYGYEGLPASGYASDGSWADDDDDETPFGGIDQVDGLVYSPETVSPELQWQQQQIDVPLPPVRERPMPMQHGRAEPWKPGPDPAPPKPQAHSSVVRLLAVTVLPLMVLLGLGMLVLRIMEAYGM